MRVNVICEKVFSVCSTLLAKNGRWSSSKRTKHIKSRYFFIKDKIDSGEVDVRYMPTDKMWSDVLTKPKQGKRFHVDRSHLMNVPEDYDEEEERRRTNLRLIPTSDGDSILPHDAHRQYCRSVLGNIRTEDGDSKGVMTQINQRRRTDQETVRILRRRGARDASTPKGKE